MISLQPTVQKVSHGNFTATIYGYIADQNYSQAVVVLLEQLDIDPKNRAALSLLGFCYYYLQDFNAAASTYEKLVKFFPDVEDYKMLYAQSLHKATMYAEAVTATLQIKDPLNTHRMQLLQANVKYEQADLTGADAVLSQCIPDHPDVIVAQGCLCFKRGDFEEARSRFIEATNLLGYKSDLAYSIALSYYREKQYRPALKYIAEIIDKGVRDHPELSVGSNADGIEVRSVGNSQTLKESALIEAFNLKAAIEYRLNNVEAAKDTMKAMPPRAVGQLDPITLMNLALVSMDTDPEGGLDKLRWLLQNPPTPPEAFSDLLLLLIKHQHFDAAADELARYPNLHSNLGHELYAFIEAAVEIQAVPEEAYRKFDLLAQKHVDELRRLTKSVQDARVVQRDNDALSQALLSLDDALERYIPVLMAQAKIYWDIKNYPMVRQILTQPSEFCEEHETWKLNFAHALFMESNKFSDAIRYYSDAVKKAIESKDGNLLEVNPVVLANLCVAYIMTSQNEDAEELMRQIEKKEEQARYDEPDKNVFHLCIVNLVIGTLYCSKGNFEFGVSRIIKSLEPYEKKLSSDTWGFAKRCFLAMAENLAKHMMIFKDEFYTDIIAFLDECEEKGADIIIDAEKNTTVRTEARMLKLIFIRLHED